MMYTGKNSNRETNAKIFQDTRSLCHKNPLLQQSITDALRSQKLILEGASLPVPDRRVYDSPADIIISSKRSYEAASAYAGQKVCVHNFASASTPGGGVVNGATAQEECLCRCSTLYFCLDIQEMWDAFYNPHRASQDSLHNDDCIYTPGVTVFKSDTAQPELLPESRWYDVNVITCAAPNLRSKPSNSMNSGDGNTAVIISDEDLLTLHEKRLKRILDIAVLEGNEVIILGAFGCGAFKNNPEVVAQAARNVLPEYLHAFKTIEFAVYCSPNDMGNYHVFKRSLKQI